MRTWRSVITRTACARPWARPQRVQSHAGSYGFEADMIVTENQDMWPCGLMDKALVFGTKDCRFESFQGQALHEYATLGSAMPSSCPPLPLRVPMTTAAQDRIIWACARERTQLVVVHAGPHPSCMLTGRKPLPGRLELPTLRLTASRSSQLS